MAQPRESVKKILGQGFHEKVVVSFKSIKEQSSHSYANPERNQTINYSLQQILVYVRRHAQ